MDSRRAKTEYMTQRGTLGLRFLSFPMLITCVVGIQALVILVVLPLLAHSISHWYGIGFADNYDRLAWSLSQGFGYRFLPNTAPTLTREPGYPVFLAGLFWLFGKSIGAARIANLVLAAVAAWLLYRFANRLFGSKSVGLLSSFLFIIHPGVFLAELRGGVEILFIVVIVAFMSLLCDALESGRIRDYVFAGLILGVATLIRSTALLFPFALVAFFLIWRSSRPSWARLCSFIAVLFAAVLLVLSPWMIRNWLVAGVPLPTATVQPIAAHAGQYICSHRTLHSKFQDLDIEAAAFRSAFARQHGFNFTGRYYMYFYDTQDELAFSRLLGEHVIDNYRKSPDLIAKCALMNVFNFWFTGKDWTATALNAAVQVPYLVLGALGMISAVRAGRGRRIGILILFIIYLMLVHLPVHAQARYSIPLIPFLSIFAATAALDIFHRRRCQRQL